MSLNFFEAAWFKLQDGVPPPRWRFAYGESGGATSTVALLE
jgi:hypothetical protein